MWTDHIKRFHSGALSARLDCKMQDLFQTTPRATEIVVTSAVKKLSVCWHVVWHSIMHCSADIALCAMSSVVMPPSRIHALLVTLCDEHPSNVDRQCAGNVPMGRFST